MPNRAVYPSAHGDDGYYYEQQAHYGPPQHSYGPPPQQQQHRANDHHGRPQMQQPQHYPQSYSHGPPPPQPQPRYHQVSHNQPEYNEEYDDGYERGYDQRGGKGHGGRGGGSPNNKVYNSAPAPSADNTRNRKCHDVLWLILFAIMFGGMVAVAYYSIRYGNVNRLIYGRDSEGNLCGAQIGEDSTRNLTGQGNLLYFVDDADNYRRCVAHCPSTTASDSTAVCRYDISLGATHSDIVSQVAAGECTYTIKSKSVMNRCVPLQLLNDIKKAANASYYNETYTLGGGSFNWGHTLSLELGARDVASVIFQDLASNWWVILVCVGAAFVLSYAYLLLLQFFAGAIVWFTIMVVLIVAWVLAAYFIYNFVRIKVLHQGLLAVGFVDVSSVLYNERVLLALGCIIGGIALILSILVMCLTRRIRLATHIIKEASRAMRAMPFIALFPFLKYTVILAWMASFLVVMALLATSGKAITNAITTDVNSGLSHANKSYKSSHTLQYLQIFYVFGFLWVYNWIIAIGQTTIAGAIAAYYWARDKKALPRFPVAASLGRVFRYHLGSLALGSLLIATVQLVRIIVLELQRRVQGTGNKFLKMILCCCQACLKCVESLLKAITKNAYVEIAIYGYSFCTAARMAVQLIASNIIRITVVHKVAGFLMLVGKLAVVFITTLGGLGLLVHLQGDDNVFANFAVPVVFILIFSYMTASAFLSTFSMAITTIFLSFCEDSQRNDGSRERPFYMSKNLQRFVDQHAHARPAV